MVDRRVNGTRSELIVMKFLITITLFMLFASGCEDKRYVDSYGTQNNTGDSEQTDDDYWFSHIEI